MKIKHTLLLCCAGLLTGCLSPVKNDLPANFMVNTVPQNVPVKHTRPLVLLVLPPDALPIYQTRRMAYIMRPYEVQYFAENQWAETPSEMLLPLLVQTMQNTKHYRGVVSPPYAGTYNYALGTQILRFEQDFMSQPASFKLVARVGLYRMVTNQLVATKEYKISIPISGNTPYSGVIAANNATKRLLEEVARFAIQHT